MEPLQWGKKKIELHNFLYVLDISNTFYSIINHGRQPDWLFVIKNGAITVGFPTFTLLANTNKKITLDADLSFKDQQSHPDYTNLLNDFSKTNVSLIHDKSATPKRSTKDSAAYNIHRV